jgi:hypothetical protein
MVELYPPVSKLPPTEGSVMSVNAPPFIIGSESSSTPPSNPLSKLKFCSNLNCAHESSKKLGLLTIRYLSLRDEGEFTHNELGSEAAGGDGDPEFEVCQSIPSGSTPFVEVQPGGSAGGV